MTESPLSIGLYAQLACFWEATARKPGNVDPYHDFADLKFVDFLLSAAAIGPVLEQAERQSVGETVLQGIQATRRVVTTNTNLGMVLLLAPLAAVPPRDDLRAGVARVLRSLTVDDSRQVYQAIRLAVPGGLGRAATQDVADEPTLPLREVMALAAERDRIAGQYAEDFRQVFDEGVPALCHGLERTGTLEDAIIFCHLSWMANHPDSLIARKRGRADAEEAARQARAVLAAGGPPSAAGRQALARLDDWLRTEGHSRNPGTSADLVTACLFVALRKGLLTVPCRFPWTIRP